MSDPLTNWLSLVPYTVFVASLVGSIHCLGMCGGIALAASRTKSQQVAYHLGRMLGYGGLGVLAGFFGKTLVSSSEKWLGVFAVVLFGIAYIVLGVRAWNRKPLKIFTLPQRYSDYLRKLLPRHGLVTGVLTALLPCGWLHVFVLGAAATASPWRGGIYMLLFWAGSVPILSSGSLILVKLFSPIAIHFPRFSACALILIGFITIGLHFIPPKTQSCHAQFTNLEKL